jgi:hypothetical protein
MQKDCRNNPCQRFGSKLNLNLHLHVLALDGAYSVMSSPELGSQA